MGTASPSSAPESSLRGQTSPTTALVAVAMVCLGVSLYATVLSSTSVVPDRELATPTLERAYDTLAPAGVVEPTRLRSATKTGPAGYRLNVSIVANEARWQAGPAPPAATDRASQRVAVRTQNGSIRPGSLVVRVWR